MFGWPGLIVHIQPLLKKNFFKLQFLLMLTNVHDSQTIYENYLPTDVPTNPQ